MHLMELSERSSASSMVHNVRKNGLPFWNKKHSNTNQMVIAFEAYQQLSSIAILTMTAISALNTIHEDICISEYQKRVAMIIVPFHKHQRVDGTMEALGCHDYSPISQARKGCGTMESLGHLIHQVNQVLRHAPCPVEILMDRGLGGTTQSLPALMNKAKNIKDSSGNMTGEEDKTKSGELFFDDFINYSKKQDSATYPKREVGSKVDIIGALKSISKGNLFLVGRSPPIAPLMETSDSPSVLVIQQFTPNENLKQLVEEDEESGDLISDILKQFEETFQRGLDQKHVIAYYIELVDYRTKNFLGMKKLLRMK
ncbi:hypothetical protein K2173_021183 [Erythroxylum novogranatense]|uniref:Cation/H(+) antiporter central domain-containing protein n=1 Tax=Erythroxylum novogranatense TaxID=1862640 RepID=A0AAV8TQX7_9ROSI|nr:hypothetical protein K2173_021183 [Erythroxylum novogranatense]